MAESTKSADIAQGLRSIQRMLGNAIEMSGDADDALKISTKRLEELLNLHKVVGREANKGKGLIKTLSSRAWWDKHLYKLVFIFYLPCSFQGEGPN